MSGQVQSILTNKNVQHSKPNPQTKAGQQARRQLFVSAFLANRGDAKAAAISAGANPNTAGTIGRRILNHPEVIAAIDEHCKAVAARSIKWTTEQQMTTLHEIATDPRQPAGSRVAAISLAMDVTGAKSPTKSQSLSVSATIGPDGMPMLDPLQAIAPRLDAWRKLQSMIRPASLLSPAQDDKIGQVPEQVKEQAQEQVDNLGQTEQIDTTARDAS